MSDNASIECCDPDKPAMRLGCDRHYWPDGCSSLKVADWDGALWAGVWRRRGNER